MEIEEYRKQFIDEIRNDASLEGSDPESYFIERVLTDLEDIGELSDPIPMSIEIRNTRRQILAFDGYSYDEADGALVLIASEFTNQRDSAPTLTNTRIEELLSYMQRFIEEADMGDTLDKYGITLDCGELSYYKTMDVAYYSGAKLYVTTEMTLTDEEAAEIMASVKAELADFDERGYFTKSANTNSPEVYIVIWSAPWEQDTANGSNYHTWTEMYGYTMGFYQE